MKHSFLLSIFVLTLAVSCRPQGASAPGYTPVLSPAAAGVSVIEKMQPGCTPAGQIVGRAAAAEAGEVVWRYALNDLRNQALARRVMVVFMEKYDHSTEKGLLHIRITGTLLQCGTASPSHDGEPAGGVAPPPSDVTPPVADGPGTGPGAGEEIEPPPAGDDPEAVTPPPVQ
jgi:hypothetical protein